MAYRCLGALLLVLGGALVCASIFPVFQMMRLPAQWEMGLIASKLVMLPLGVGFLACGAGLRARAR